MKHRIRIFYRDSTSPQVARIYVIDEPHVVYINLYGNKNGVFMLIRSLSDYCMTV